ncbi:hypothetical protein Q7C36_016485 [Tachysurus vachellii]|uniref:Uncharacterized protein n=1 Tax=Tachysurus vachellii TaxID=175792 RepID=A0AA88M6F8_TACVA|nr:hypothetical protein Q7C36_016485 [Tachysurus vachellii]
MTTPLFEDELGGTEAEGFCKNSNEDPLDGMCGSFRLPCAPIVYLPSANSGPRLSLANCSIRFLALLFPAPGSLQLVLFSGQCGPLLL